MKVKLTLKQGKSYIIAQRRRSKLYSETREKYKFHMQIILMNTDDMEVKK